MFIEQLRTDSLYVGNTDIRVSALFAFICVIVIVPIMIVARVKQRKLVKNEEISATTLCSLPVVLGIKKNGYVKAESAEDSGFDTQEMNAAENAEDTKKVSAKISGKMFSEEEKAEENTVHENTVHRAMEKVGDLIHTEKMIRAGYCLDGL